ncbi:hypothetical protein OM074_20485, partial [Marinilabiliaceae bacterium D04]|nr:hypothetical protein [Plebeiobacterium marinum]
FSHSTYQYFLVCPNLDIGMNASYAWFTGCLPSISFAKVLIMSRDSFLQQATKAVPEFKVISEQFLSKYTCSIAKTVVASWL